MRQIFIIRCDSEFQPSIKTHIELSGLHLYFSQAGNLPMQTVYVVGKGLALSAVLQVKIFSTWKVSATALY